MPSNAIEGIKIKIGADLSGLKKELGLVDDTVKDNIDPARKEVKGLSRDFNDAATKARKISINVQEVAAVAVKLGSALTGFTKGLIEEAVKVDPDTAANVEAVKESFASIKQSIVGAIIPLIETWGPKLTALFQSIAQWINDNPETAEGLFKVSAAVGGIAVAAGTALPIVVQLQIALAGVSATALGIAGVVVGAITILAILSSTLDDISAKASQTAEEIANMDTTTQKIVENGIGELSVENRDDYDWVANVWDPVKKEFVEGWAYLDEYTGEYVLVSEEVATAASETASAIAETTAATDTAKTASEEATDILTGLQQSMESLGAATQEIDLTEINSMLESEAFRQLASEPISEDVSESWTTFGTAVSTASDGFSSMSGTISDESPFSIALAALPAKLDSVRTAAESLGEFLSGGFVTSIQTLMTFLCMTSTDEEGNADAGGGNTLFNALGEIFGLFESIYATSQLLAQYWVGSFVSASVTMRNEAGTATSVVEGLGNSAQTAADHFYNLAERIYDVIDAYLDLMRVKGGGGGGGTGKSTDLFKASGGPVSAGSPYVVGELGPEVFIPNVKGTIIPNDRVSAGGPTVNVIFQGQVIGDERTISAYVTKACNKAIKEAVYAGA